MPQNTQTQGLAYTLALVFFLTLAQAEEPLAAAQNPSSDSTITSVFVRTMDKRTYISGTVRRPAPVSLAPGAHVHVELLNKGDRVIQKGVDRLPWTSPRHDATHARRSPYVVSFQASDTASASKIRVTFINGSHGQCAKESTS